VSPAGAPVGGEKVAGGDQRLAGGDEKAATSKRRQILDAAVRVFARQGFHACRVSGR